jgi:hypothetical protein
MKDEIEIQLEARLSRRLAAEGRMLDRYEILCNKAESLIGELVREGKTVYYINLRNLKGAFTGKIKIGKFAELCDYLIRNRYV